MKYHHLLHQLSLRLQFHMKCLPQQMLASTFPFTTKQTLSLLSITRAVLSTHTRSATTTIRPTPAKVLHRTETRRPIHHPSSKRYTIRTHLTQRCTRQTNVHWVTRHQLPGVQRCTTHSQGQARKASTRTLPPLHRDSLRMILSNNKSQFTTHGLAIPRRPRYIPHGPSPMNRDTRRMDLQEGTIDV